MYRLLKAFFRELPEPLLPPELNRRAADIVSAGEAEISTALALVSSEIRLIIML